MPTCCRSPSLHDGDPVAHRHRLDLVMGDIDGRRPQPMAEAPDLRAGLHPQLGVEVGERLVHQEDGRLADDRPAQGHPLPLATGERLRLAVEELLEAKDLGRLLDPPVDLRLRRLAQLQPEGHVVEDRHVRVQGVALEDHRDVAVLGRHVVDHAVTDQDLSLADLLESGHAAQGGRLAAARGTDEHQELPIGDLEAQVVDRHHVAPEALVDVVEGDSRHPEVSSPHWFIGLGPERQPS